MDRAAHDPGRLWIAAALQRRLEQFPDAPVFALDEWATGVPVPAELGVAGHPQMDVGAAMELVRGDDRPNALHLWNDVRARGAARVRTRLRDGSEVVVVLYDQRPEHGVIVGVLLPASDDGGDVPALSLEPLPVRHGTMRRDAIADILDADDGAVELLGWSRDELRGLAGTSLVHRDDHERALSHWIDLLSSPGIPRRWRGRHLRADGSFCWFEFTDVNRLDDPDVGAVVSEMVDISDEMAAVESLRRRERLLDRLTEALPNGVMQIDRDRSVVHQNDRMAEIFGVRASAVEELYAVVVDDDRPALDAAIDAVLGDGADLDLEIRLDGERSGRRVLQILVRGLDDDGELDGAIISATDVTESSRLRDELQVQARHDPLTGCLNRRSIMFRLEEVLSSSRTGDEATAVVFVDLDRFKDVNDRLGHAAGDELLVRLADQLRAAVRGADLVGRLGGDEFLVVCPDVAHPDLAAELANRLAASVAEPVVIAGEVMVPRASFGTGWARNGGVDVDELVAMADAAMYESKGRGGVPVLRTSRAHPT